jgi:uncharacterized protein (TIGR01619 family)
MNEDWDFYLSTVDDHPASVFVDLKQIETAPDESRPWLLRVSVPMKSPRDDGLTDREEADLLDAIEDELFAAVARILRARYIGRITTQGAREHFYYGSSAAGFAEGVAKAMLRFPQNEAACRDQADPQWETYSNLLFPSDLDLQSIHNRRLVNQLTENGDDLSQPRDIDHWLYFPSEESRDQFLVQIAGNGFRAESFLDKETDVPFRFGVRLIRSDRVELETIDGIVTDLLLRAENSGGAYDGWAAPVVRG